MHSADRATLWQGLQQGLAEGLGGRPAGNAEVLAGFGTVSASVALAESAATGADS